MFVASKDGRAWSESAHDQTTESYKQTDVRKDDVPICRDQMSWQLQTSRTLLQAIGSFRLDHVEPPHPNHLHNLDEHRSPTSLLLLGRGLLDKTPLDEHFVGAGDADEGKNRVVMTLRFGVAAREGSEKEKEPGRHRVERKESCKDR